MDHKPDFQPLRQGPAAKLRRQGARPAVRVLVGLAIVAGGLVQAGAAAPAGRAQGGGKVWVLRELVVPAQVEKVSERRFAMDFLKDPNVVDGRAEIEVEVPSEIEPEPAQFSIAFDATAMVRLGTVYPPERGAFLNVETAALLGAAPMGEWPRAQDRANDVGGGVTAHFVATSRPKAWPPLTGPFDHEDRSLTIRFTLTAGPEHGPGGPPIGTGVQVLTVDAIYDKKPPPPPDLDLVGPPVVVQVTEARGIYGDLAPQDEIPLVRHKPFAVRATVLATRPTKAFVVRAAFSDAKIPDVTEFYTGDDLTAGWVMKGPFETLSFPKPGVRTIYFFPERPVASTNPILVTTVNVDLYDAVSEASEDNNRATANSPVLTTRWDGQDGQMRLHFAPILARYMGSLIGCERPVSDETESQLTTALAELMPVERVFYTSEPWVGPFALWAPPKRLTGQQFLSFARAVLKRGRLDDPAAARIVGVLPRNWFGNVGPLALSPRRAIAFPFTPLGRLILAECGSGSPVGDVLNSYGIASLPDDSAVRPVGDGLWVQWKTPMRNGALDDTMMLKTVGDLMGAAPVLGPRYDIGPSDLSNVDWSWISGRDYWLLLCGWTNAAACGKPAPPAAARLGRAAAPAQAPEGVIMVSGSLERKGGGRLEPAYRLPAGRADASGSGPYVVALVDSGGQVLEQLAFDADWALLESLDMADAAYPFDLVLPWHPTTAGIVLRRASTVLDTLLVSASPPRVRVASPNGGEALSDIHDVSWTGEDPDGERLTYIVRYSPDRGSSWQTLASDVTETRFEWDTGLSAGGDGALIEVLASDGVNTSRDSSDALFAVADKAPAAAISDPPDGATFERGYPIDLRGGGSDPEAGPLPGSALAWSSDRDGPLGSGTRITTTLLSPGEHTVTLSARDGRGQIGMATRRLRVVAPAPPDLWFTAAGLTIAPAAPVDKSVAQIRALLHASGRDVRCTVFADDGDPRTGGRPIGSDDVVVAPNRPAVAVIEWRPGGAGPHSLHLRASGCQPAEADTSNNWAAFDVTVVPTRRHFVFLPLVTQHFDLTWPVFVTTPTLTPPPSPTPGTGPAATLTPGPTATFTPVDTPVTPTPGTASPTHDPIGTAIAATLTALAPTTTATPSRSPTPDLVATAVAATLTALASTPTVTATPTPTRTPTSGLPGRVTLDGVGTTGADGRPRMAFGPGDKLVLALTLSNDGSAAVDAEVTGEVIGHGGFLADSLSWQATLRIQPGTRVYTVERLVTADLPWGPYTFIGTLAAALGPTTASSELFLGTKLLGADDFHDPGSGWQTVDVAEYRCGYLDGEYHIVLRQPNYWVRTAAPVPAMDFVVEADLRLPGNARGVAGQAHNTSADGQDFTFFAVDSDGRYALFRRTGGAWIPLVAWTPSPAIRGPGQVNHVMLVQRGVELRLYANGTELAVLNDAVSVRSSRLGLYAESRDAGVEARFDNWRAYELPAGQPSGLRLLRLRDLIPPAVVTRPSR